MKGALALVALAACGGASKAGGETPEDPARAMIAASERCDLDAERAAFASPAALREVLTCPAGHGVEEAYERVRRDLAADPCGDEIEVTEIRDRPTPVAAGARWRGCTAKVALAMHQLEVREHVVSEHDAFDGGPDLDVIELDGHWYLVPGGL